MHRVPRRKLRSKIPRLMDTDSGRSGFAGIHSIAASHNGTRRWETGQLRWFQNRVLILDSCKSAKDNKIRPNSNSLRSVLTEISPFEKWGFWRYQPRWWHRQWQRIGSLSRSPCFAIMELGAFEVSKFGPNGSVALVTESCFNAWFL